MSIYPSTISRPSFLTAFSNSSTTCSTQFYFIHFENFHFISYHSSFIIIIIIIVIIIIVIIIIIIIIIVIIVITIIIAIFCSLIPLAMCYD
ncbi:unnamed protein product [Brugia pahangi]|uniref:Uncharacterized protein n=1 Tax=Brugia pahangi TaxID=6280 RepID=A0A3P7R1W7_BRUPA|nr:unnamed protein product [Brugia pahangi]